MLMMLLLLYLCENWKPKQWNTYILSMYLKLGWPHCWGKIIRVHPRVAEDDQYKGKIMYSVCTNRGSIMYVVPL